MPGRSVLVGMVAIASCSSQHHAATPDAPGGHDEPCNGLDDDGDGAIDEGCRCTPFDVSVPVEGTTEYLSLTWTGIGYLVTGIDPAPIESPSVPRPPLLVAWVAPDGTTQHVAREGDGGGNVGDGNSLTSWDGSQLGMLVRGLAPYELAFQRFDPVTSSFSARWVVSNDPTFAGTAGIV